MFNLDKVHMILDEMIMNGQIVETNRARILAPIYLLDQATAKRWPPPKTMVDMNWPSGTTQLRMFSFKPKRDH